ncbi:hypothetical protein BX666DRAFT_2016106 [Dichotomocladium elegans]|nr:hypothetical protein BX666DRAFT_2016106 [Dichotomocladium elegans]
MLYCCNKSLRCCVNICSFMLVLFISASFIASHNFSFSCMIFLLSTDMLLCMLTVTSKTSF